MPNFKTTDVAAGQGLYIEVNLKEQLLPGSFEYMLDKLIGSKIDISVFNKNYKNDVTGASAISPTVLMKLIFYGYHHGQKSSRKIWELSRNNIVAKALTSDINIHWTTIAKFITGNKEKITEVFTEVLIYCNELGLIGGEDFASDGLRLPSNASTNMSGTKKELEKRVEVYRKMSEKHLERHIKADQQGEIDEEKQERFEARQKQLGRKIENINSFLKEMKEKKGKNGEEIKSNVTDNESALIYSPKGYIQGYIGIAVADSKNQIIVAAQAVGTANEGEHLPDLLDKTLENLEKAKVKEPEGKARIILADSNYSSEETLHACQERGVEAIIPDGKSKSRIGPDGQKRYDADDFIYHEAGNYYECPNKKNLVYKGIAKMDGSEDKKIYQASLSDCKTCPFFSKCSKTKKAQEKIRQGRKLLINKSNEEGCLSRQMRKKLQTKEYQKAYSRRIQIIEPVFANIGYSKGLNRFTVRGKEKVNSQWLLYCMMHNLGKCLNEYNERGYVA